MDQAFDAGYAMDCTACPLPVSIDYSSSISELSAGNWESYSRDDLSGLRSRTSCEAVAKKPENNNDLAMFMSMVYQLSNDF